MRRQKRGNDVWHYTKDHTYKSSISMYLFLKNNCCCEKFLLGIMLASKYMITGKHTKLPDLGMQIFTCEKPSAHTFFCPCKNPQMLKILPEAPKVIFISLHSLLYHPKSYALGQNKLTFVENYWKLSGFTKDDWTGNPKISLF